MAIYKIENDDFRFQELDLEISDFISSFPDEFDDLQIYDFGKNNLSLAEYWPSMLTGFSEIEGNENLIPDITYWIGATLLLSPRAYRLLADLLKPFGEFLPIWIEQELYQIFNCLTVCEAHGNDIYEFTFDTTDLAGKQVFKPPYKFDCNLFCTDLLKNAVEDFELKGITFELQ